MKSVISLKSQESALQQKDEKVGENNKELDIAKQVVL